MRKENRDRVWNSMSKEEKSRHRRSSDRNQLLHPMYVEDYEKVTGTKLSPEDKGFGNMIYKTYFARLYIIAEKLILGGRF